MNSILTALQKTKSFESFNQTSDILLGLPKNARIPFLAANYLQEPKVTLLLTNRGNDALSVISELRIWLPTAPIFYFPEPTASFYENLEWGENTRIERLMVLSILSSYLIPGIEKPEKPPIIFAPARAYMAYTIPRRHFMKATTVLKIGSRLDPIGLSSQWVNSGYESVSTVVAPGQFCRRGGILDIWTPAHANPVRIDFFGDEIDSMKNFDPATQRTQEKINRIFVTPAKEYLLKDIEKLELDENINPSEFHIPLCYPNAGSLSDYLPKNSVCFLNHRELFLDLVDEIEVQAISLFESGVKEGTINKDFPRPYMAMNEVLDSFEKNSIIDMDEAENPAGLFFNQFKQLRRFAGQIRPFIDEVRSLLQNNDEIIIVSRQSERIKEIWSEDVFYFEELATAPIKFIQGSLAEGFSFQVGQKRFYLFTDAEIFGWNRPQASHRPRVRSETPESDYIPFEENEYVVHIDHGIGKYIGLVKRQLNDSIIEYLCVEYANNDQLFIPVYQADRLTRYLGSNDGSPKMTRLGGTDWNQVKSRVQKAVEDIAEDLLELFAKRNVIEAEAYGADTQWQKEMEASFPFIETEDQLRVIKEVKKDLESPKPMDRLVCGDVGYGKTEVALRAAFKTVMEGKQVAFLVPTTILAQQHFKTFSQRLAGFPVNVEMLSRFRTEREQRSVLHAMAEGTVDIVIGTHRLVQNDINFKDLGLLIIDEEQRFGVSHKEHLKKMRTEVNVLTMTATPIPRTLYLTLTGIRDISTIQTAPEERLPIFTHVGAYSAKFVRQAVLRELERGGQVFFVHNRVQTIRSMEMQLHNLIPEAKIAVVHGQMNEKDLSKNMRMFADNEVDILLATSIIESGLDIPNANTLIVDRADTFGLAQLYQIKGRVGRGAQRAYAYFFRHPSKSPTDEGRQRLETLAENTQLGAGYSISMRDLEIRGAGDIIGTRQHGHISAVGFHLYTRLLSQAIKNLKIQGNYLDAEIEEVFSPLVNVDLPILVNIPETYVSDEYMRLRLYRRIADMRKIDEVNALHDEFEDRFGNLPSETKNLLYQLKIKILAGLAEVESITAENGMIVLRFVAIDESMKQRPFPILPINVRVNRNSLRVPYSENPKWQNDLLNILTQQISFMKK